MGNELLRGMLYRAFLCQFGSLHKLQMSPLAPTEAAAKLIDVSVDEEPHRNSSVLYGQQLPRLLKFKLAPTTEILCLCIAVKSPTLLIDEFSIALDSYVYSAGPSAVRSCSCGNRGHLKPLQKIIRKLRIS